MKIKKHFTALAGCTLIAFMLTTGMASAQKQKVTWDKSKDTVYVDGQPYALLFKKTVDLLRWDYRVSALNGTELIYFKSSLRDYNGGFRAGTGREEYFEMNFIASGSYAELGHYSGTGFAKLIVENNLIKDNAIDAESEKRFIMLNHGTLGSMPSASAETTSSPAVVVNINNSNGGAPTAAASPASAAAPKAKTPVTLNGNQIVRDDAVIGKFRVDTTSSTYSQKNVIVTVYSEGGEKVAEASVPVNNPREWSIKTISDNKSFNLMYDSPGEKEKLFRWLADKSYLSN